MLSLDWKSLQITMRQLLIWRTYDHIEQHLRPLQAFGENKECKLIVSSIQLKQPKTILVKLEEYKKSGDPWTLGRWSIELKRYVAAPETGDRLVNRYKKSDSSKRKVYPSNDWKKQRTFEQQST